MPNKAFKKIIFITGASGFIGYNVCKHFLKNGWEVFGLAKSGKVPMGVKLIKVNLLNFKKLKSEIRKINPFIVLHLGAYVVLDRNFEVAQKCVDVNIKGTLNLIESVKNLSLKKFIFFSTEEVYGENKIPYKETQIIHPPSPYSISKATGENLCLLYYNLYSLPVVIIRLATIFGYYQPSSRFIPNIIARAIENKPILLNSGKKRRDYLFVEELLKAIEKTIKSRKAIGEIINIGHTDSITGKDLAQKIVKLSNSKSEIIVDSFPDRKGEAMAWGMNNFKAQKILGWKPKKTIDECLEKTINFYKTLKTGL